MGPACARMVGVVLPALFHCVDPTSAVAMAPAPPGAVCATRGTTDATVRFGSVNSAAGLTDTASTAPARARMGGRVKIAKLLSVRMTALGTGSVTRAPATAIWVGPRLIALRRSA